MPFFRMTSDCSAKRNSSECGRDNWPDEMPTTLCPFDRSAEIEWSPVWSLRDEQFKYLPTSLLYFFYKGPRGEILADSNGCAAGNTLEEAIVQGFLELVERDSYAIWWYNRLQRAAVDLSQIGDAYVNDFRSSLPETGRRLWVLDITSDFEIPELCGGDALDGKLAGTHRVWFWRALRYENSDFAGDDRTQSISVHRFHGGS